jgi:hypothetical protein
MFAEEAEFFGKIDRGGHTERSGERIFFRVTGEEMRIAAAMVHGRGLGYDSWNTHKICWAGPVAQTRLQELAAISFLVFQAKGCDGAFVSFEDGADAEVLLGCESNLSEG